MTAAPTARASEVFETMFFQAVTALPPSDGFPLPAYLVTVEFAGHAAGVCEVAVTEGEAHRLGLDFLACEPDDLNVREVLCELGNMVCGHVLSWGASAEWFDTLPPACVELGPGAALPDFSWTRFQLGEGEAAVRLSFRPADTPSPLPAVEPWRTTSCA